MRKGALDLSLVPLSYAGGEVPETNLGLMPGVVTSYEQGATWKKAPIGKAMADLLYDKGVIILSWILAGRGRREPDPGDRRTGRCEGAEGARRKP